MIHLIHNHIDKTYRENSAPFRTYPLNLLSDTFSTRVIVILITLLVILSSVLRINLTGKIPEGLKCFSLKAS